MPLVQQDKAHRIELEIVPDQLVTENGGLLECTQTFLGNDFVILVNILLAGRQNQIAFIFSSSAVGDPQMPWPIPHSHAKTACL
jgi:hypothetical protein